MLSKVGQLAFAWKADTSTYRRRKRRRRNSWHPNVFLTTAFGWCYKVLSCGPARQLLLPMHMKSLEHSNSNSILSALSAKSWSHAGFKLPEWLKFTNKSCSAYSLDCSLKVEVRNLEHLFFMYRSQKCLIQLPVKALGEHPVAWNGTGMSTFWTAIPQVMKCEVQRSRQQNNPVYQKQRHM